MSGYVEIYRGVANSWECDIMGHLNVQFYTAKVSEGVGHLRAACGMTPRYIHEHQRTMVAVRKLVRYLRELRAGDILLIRAAVQRVGERTIDFVAEVVNAESNKVSASFDITCAHFDLRQRRALPWPDVMRGRIEALTTPRQDRPRPPSTGGPSALPAGRAHAEPFITGRGAVMAWECDEFGHMAARFFVARVSDAVGHVKKAMGLDWRTSSANHWGSAALEYNIQFLRELRAGDIVTVRSGVLEVGRKTYRFGHVLTNDTTGEVSAVYDIVACMFDLKERRSIPVPDFVRERAEALIIPWPPAAIAERASSDVHAST